MYYYKVGFCSVAGVISQGEEVILELEWAPVQCDWYPYKKTDTWGLRCRVNPYKKTDAWGLRCKVNAGDEAGRGWGSTATSQTMLGMAREPPAPRRGRRTLLCVSGTPEPC